MKGYLKYFRVYFIIILVLTVIFAALKLTGAGKQPAERGNTEAVTQERVFDYADKLTDEEEDSLRRLIAKREAQTGCDIVLVTLNESLEEYAKGYEEQLGYLYPYQYVMVYADNFYDEHLFGYNKPQGDGVLLLDNWYRESDGKVYSWLSTCGKAQDRFSSTMIDELLDKALEDVDSNPYKAYKKYVDLFYYDMTGKVHIPVAALIFVAAACTAVYVGVNLGR
ncbi:TPM domain-containing protein, partial [Eisenbergiella massiliensis]